MLFAEVTPDVLLLCWYLKGSVYRISSLKAWLMSLGY